MYFYEMEEFLMTSFEILQELDMSDSERMTKNIDKVINCTCNEICDQLENNNTYPYEMIEALANLINARNSLVINKSNN